MSGYLDDIEINAIKQFEIDLLEKVKNDQPDIWIVLIHQENWKMMLKRN